MARIVLNGPGAAQRPCPRRLPVPGKLERRRGQPEPARLTGSAVRPGALSGGLWKLPSKYRFIEA